VISANWDSAKNVALVRQSDEGSFLDRFPAFLVAARGRAATEVASFLSSIPLKRQDAL
jgi:hypothetical protein